MNGRVAKQLRREAVEVEKAIPPRPGLGRKRLRRRYVDRSFTAHGPQIRNVATNGDITFKQAHHVVNDYRYQRSVINSTNHERMLLRKGYREAIRIAMEKNRVPDNAAH